MTLEASSVPTKRVRLHEKLRAHVHPPGTPMTVDRALEYMAQRQSYVRGSFDESTTLTFDDPGSVLAREVERMRKLIALAISETEKLELEYLRAKSACDSLGDIRQGELNELKAVTVRGFLPILRTIQNGKVKR